jgi:hypothetical protein
MRCAGPPAALRPSRRPARRAQACGGASTKNRFYRDSLIVFSRLDRSVFWWKKLGFPDRLISSFRGVYREYVTEIKRADRGWVHRNYLAR